MLMIGSDVLVILLLFLNDEWYYVVCYLGISVLMVVVCDILFKQVEMVMVLIFG